jgi:uncharacterized membrane protein
VSFKTQNLFTTHRIFIAVLLGKAVLGTVQLVIGVALYFGILTYAPLIAGWLVRNELSEDPHDFLASKVMSLANMAPMTDATFYMTYFAAHGVLHLGVVAALLWGARWANHVAVVVLGLFVVFQLIEWLRMGGVLLLILTAIDLAVIYLTVREHRQSQRPA